MGRKNFSDDEYLHYVLNSLKKLLREGGIFYELRIL